MNMINNSYKPLEDVEDTTITVPAGVTIPFQAIGEFVRCLESDDDIKISFNSGSPVTFGTGRYRRMRAGQTYESFELESKALLS